MQVDNVLILAAGKGTRMGSIGEKMPKVTWPIFTKSIIELEVLYAKRFNPKQIFINTYYYKDKVKEHLNASSLKNEFIIIDEEEPLDIGGAVHNLAQKLNYKGNLLILNSDQFIFMESELQQMFLDTLEGSDSVLLTYEVQKEDGYNALDVKNERVLGVVENEFMDQSSFQTYTGMSFIKLDSLKQTPGESKFFSSVIDFSKMVKAINMNKSHYWDFGTLSRYYDSMFEICRKVNEEQKDMFIDFLISNNVLNRNLVSRNSYNSKTSNIINLTQAEINSPNTIILDNSSKKNHEKKSILRGTDEDLIP